MGAVLARERAFANVGRMRVQEQASAARTAVAMSGGVDSSVAACLLAGGPRPLVGFSMQLVDRLAGETERYGRCCSPEDFRDARSVADRMGFPHYVLDMEDEFQRNVLLPFAEDYAAGRTPSPCVRCNTYVKFGGLLKRARAADSEGLWAERIDRVVQSLYVAFLQGGMTGLTELNRNPNENGEERAAGDLRGTQVHLRFQTAAHPAGRPRGAPRARVDPGPLVRSGPRAHRTSVSGSRSRRASGSKVPLSIRRMAALIASGRWKTRK